MIFLIHHSDNPINFNMKKELKNIQTFEQHTDKNLNISDVRSRLFAVMADDYIILTILEKRRC